MLAHLPVKCDWVSSHDLTLHTPELECKGHNFKALYQGSKYRQDLDTAQTIIHITFIKEDSGTLHKHATAVIQNKGESQPRGSEGKLAVTASTVAGQQFSLYPGQFIHGGRRKDRNYGKGTPSAHSRCNCTFLLQQSL